MTCTITVKNGCSMNTCHIRLKLAPIMFTALLGNIYIDTLLAVHECLGVYGHPTNDRIVHF